MSLTILVDKKLPRVGIIRWFKDPKFTLNYACGPLMELDMEQFRTGGYDLVLSHFAEHERIRIAERDAKPVFGGVDERKYLMRQRPVQVSKNPATQEIRLSPFDFRNYSLGGLVSKDLEYCRILPVGFTMSQFWEAFDVVLAEVS